MDVTAYVCVCADDPGRYTLHRDTSMRIGDGLVVFSETHSLRLCVVAERSAPSVSA